MTDNTSFMIIYGHRANLGTETVTKMQFSFGKTESRDTCQNCISSHGFSIRE